MGSVRLANGLVGGTAVVVAGHAEAQAYKLNHCRTIHHELERLPHSTIVEGGLVHHHDHGHQQRALGFQQSEVRVGLQLWQSRGISGDQDVDFAALNGRRASDRILHA
jgi:hypothetical protein